MGLLKDHLIGSSYSHDTYDILSPEPDVGYMVEDALAEWYDEKLENRCEAQWQANNLMRSMEG
jgi:hypothetical protein